jgi:hypothetical protein
VADNGPGMPISQRTNVFRRFTRLGSELERSTPGTGLGLFLVRSLVKQLPRQGDREGPPARPRHDHGSGDPGSLRRAGFFHEARLV